MTRTLNADQARIQARIQAQRLAQQGHAQKCLPERLSIGKKAPPLRALSSSSSDDDSDSSDSDSSDSDDSSSVCGQSRDDESTRDPRFFKYAFLLSLQYHQTLLEECSPTFKRTHPLVAFFEDVWGMADQDHGSKTTDFVPADGQILKTFHMDVGGDRNLVWFKFRNVIHNMLLRVSFGKVCQMWKIGGRSEADALQYLIDLAGFPLMYHFLSTSADKCITYLQNLNHQLAITHQSLLHQEVIPVTFFVPVIVNRTGTPYHMRMLLDCITKRCEEVMGYHKKLNLNRSHILKANRVTVFFHFLVISNKPGIDSDLINRLKPNQNLSSNLGASITVLRYSSMTKKKGNGYQMRKLPLIRDRVSYFGDMALDMWTRAYQMVKWGSGGTPKVFADGKRSFDVPPVDEHVIGYYYLDQNGRPVNIRTQHPDFNESETVKHVGPEANAAPVAPAPAPFGTPSGFQVMVSPARVIRPDQVTPAILNPVAASPAQGVVAGASVNTAPPACSSASVPMSDVNQQAVLFCQDMGVIKHVKTYSVDPTTLLREQNRLGIDPSEAIKFANECNFQPKELLEDGVPPFLKSHIADVAQSSTTKLVFDKRLAAHWGRAKRTRAQISPIGPASQPPLKRQRKKSRAPKPVRQRPQDFTSEDLCNILDQIDADSCLLPDV